MAEKMMKIGGKNPQGNATAICVDETGNVGVRRVWEIKQANVSELVRDSSTLQANGTYAIYGPTFDVSGWGMVSLRIENKLSVPVKIYFYNDTNIYNILRNTDGDQISFSAAANADTIVTPDDFPLLNYMKTIKLMVSAANTVDNDEGKSVKVIAIMKR